MTIRNATSADIDAILQLGLECHRESASSSIPVDIAHSRRIIAQFVNSAARFAMVKEVDGVLVGCLLGGLAPVWFNQFSREASDLLFYVKQDKRAVGAGRLLLKRFKRWAQERGAVRLAMAVSYGGAPARRTGKIYEKEGCTQVGGLFYFNFPQEANCHERAG